MKKLLFFLLIVSSLFYLGEANAGWVGFADISKIWCWDGSLKIYARAQTEPAYIDIRWQAADGRWYGGYKRVSTLDHNGKEVEPEVETTIENAVTHISLEKGITLRIKLCYDQNCREEISCLELCLADLDDDWTEFRGCDKKQVRLWINKEKTLREKAN